MFWNNLVSLCNERGTTPNGVCSELGLSAATATKWKKGAVPRDTTLQRVADYFGVTVDYLLGEEKKEQATAPILSIPALSPEELRVIQRYRSVSPEIQAAVRKILDIPNGDEELIPVYHAAHSKDGTEEDRIIYRTREEVERLQNAPESDLDI